MTSDDKAITFKLPNTLMMDNVAEIAQQLKEASHMASVIILDAQELDRISTPGLQLLLALQKTLEAKGGRLQVGTGAALREACERCGLADYWVQWNGVQKNG